MLISVEEGAIGGFVAHVMQSFCLEGATGRAGRGLPLSSAPHSFHPLASWDSVWTWPHGL